MNDLLTKLIFNKQITDIDINDALAEICEDRHATCDSMCPVYEINRGIPWDSSDKHNNCVCFGDGAKMRQFIIDHTAS